MNLTQVINALVEERGLEREKIIEIVCDGVVSAYQKKYPELDIEAVFNQKLGAAEVFIKKTIVRSVGDPGSEITARRAASVKPRAKLGDEILVPFDKPVGRIEIASAKQIIATRIRQVEQLAIYNEFKDREGAIVSGTAHKRERGGLVVKVGDNMAFLPRSHSISGEAIGIGYPVRALLKEVASISRGGYQLILDRASADFVRKLLELEIPEVFEGLVEIKKIVRIPGYKTKVLVLSHSKEIDPVGTCVGVGGARIKPILKELGQEKIDLIEWRENSEELVKESLKPAEIDKVDLIDEGRAMVWLAQDQRSLAIGKLGQNITLASRLTGVGIQLQEVGIPRSDGVFLDDDEDENSVLGGGAAANEEEE